MSTLHSSVTLFDNPDLEEISASCWGHGDGHIANVNVGYLQLHASGDGTANLLAVLDDMRTKVEQAHTEWLAEKATAAGLVSS